MVGDDFSGHNGIFMRIVPKLNDFGALRALLWTLKQFDWRLHSRATFWAISFHPFFVIGTHFVPPFLAKLS
jgi:hypothetical protein